MKGKVGTVGLLLAVAWALGIPPMVQAAGEGEKDRPRVQVALLLDTSGSMEGLVDQARHQLWKIVNEFSAARRNGEIPELQVALYEYGNSGLEAESGYIRQVAPLTDDLDRVSEALFQLTINGGSEHCGQVIGRAVKELAWSASNRDLKCIFIAGNEPFTQGPVDFRTACRDAAARNITVSTIYCGDRLEGINTLWAEGARLADGSYLSIDHNRQVVQRETPHDAELVRLSGELNETYVAYGRAEQRESAQQRQIAQDANAAGLSLQAAAMRCVTKGGSFYNNASWDLVDACRQKVVKLEDLKEEELSEELRAIPRGERAAYIEAKGARRAELQARIAKVNQERIAFLAEEEKKETGDEEKTLDRAILECVRQQAELKEFRFE